MERIFLIEYYNSSYNTWKVLSSQVTEEEVKKHYSLNKDAWLKQDYRLTELVPRKIFVEVVSTIKIEGN